MCCKIIKDLFAYVCFSCSWRRAISGFSQEQTSWQTDDESVRMCFGSETPYFASCLTHKLQHCFFDTFSFSTVCHDDFRHSMAEPLSENWRLVLKPHPRWQFVTKMKNWSEEHKWVVLIHYSDCLFLFFAFSFVHQTNTNTYVIDLMANLQARCLL